VYIFAPEESSEIWTIQIEDRAFAGTPVKHAMDAPFSNER
jgi:hypothetical protein